VKGYLEFFKDHHKNLGGERRKKIISTKPKTRWLHTPSNYEGAIESFQMPPWKVVFSH